MSSVPDLWKQQKFQMCHLRWSRDKEHLKMTSPMCITVLLKGRPFQQSYFQLTRIKAREDTRVCFVSLFPDFKIWSPCEKKNNDWLYTKLSRFVKDIYPKQHRKFYVVLVEPSWDRTISFWSAKSDTISKYAEVHNFRACAVNLTKILFWIFFQIELS